MSACVLPLAPDFQDPLSSPNYSPVIVGTVPPAGSIVTGAPTTTTTFRVTVSDPNVGDDLHIRWLVDYPRLDDDTRILVSDLKISHSADGQPIVQDSELAIGCRQQLAPLLTQHQVMALVADREYEPVRLDGVDNLTKLTDDTGFVVAATWILSVGCRP